MSGWFESAARVFGRGASAPPPEAAPFEVVCRCGRRSDGDRASNYQVVDCPGCGESLFVLGLDVYPRAKPKKKKANPAVESPARESFDDGDEIEPTDSDRGGGARRVNDPSADTVDDGDRSWEANDEFDDPMDGEALPEAPPPVLKPPAPPKKPARPVLTPDDLQWGPPPEPWSAKWARARAAVAIGLVSLRRRITPVRLLAVGALIAVTLTAVLVRRSQALEQAEIVLRTRAETVEKLLADGARHELEEELRIHSAACSLLERDDDAARRLHALLRETVATNRLAPGSLFSLLDEANKATGGIESDWGSHFERNYRGRWIVLDGPLARVADPEGKVHWLVDISIDIGGKPLRLEAELEAFSSLSETPPALLFAAQLDAFRLPRPDDPTFVLVLAPETGFAWQRPETLPFTGLERSEAADGDEWKTRLDAQQKWNVAPDQAKFLAIVDRGLPKRMPAKPE